MKRIFSIAVAVVLVATPALAQEVAPKAKSLDELLQQVQAGWRIEREEMQKREDEFKRAKDSQQEKLAEVRATRAGAEARSEQLEKRFEEAELHTAALENTLRERLGGLGELFGAVRQVAGDAAGHVESSVVSSQIPGRTEFLRQLGQAKELPSIESLEKFWFLLQQEMTESGKVVRYAAPVVDAGGNEVERQVVRIGTFNVVADGKYLRWLPELGKLTELRRQPPARYLRTIAAFEKATDGLHTLAIDPSRGSILSMVIETPSRGERVAQGGPIGYATVVIGVIAGLIGIARFVAVFLISRKVKAQQGSDRVDDTNPLGRILGVFTEYSKVDIETLELKLDEAILRESAQLNRFLWAVKVASVVAPLMGLLGTVTGMIQVFTTITLVGTGDPKTMAGGISEALVTTMLGLFVAIPLVLIHAFVSSETSRIIEVLEEQSAGLVARRAEEAGPVVPG